MSYSSDKTFKDKDKLVQDCLKETKLGIQRCDYVNGKAVNEMYSGNMGAGSYPTDTRYAEINQVGANEPTEQQGFGDGNIKIAADNPAPNVQEKVRNSEMKEKKPDVGAEEKWA